MATKNTVRKAVMVKHTPYKFGKRFSKGDNVEVQEVPLGRGRYSYVVSNPADNSILAQNVGRSFFEYDDEETFVVMVTRISYSTKAIEVKAKDRKTAEELANAEAVNQVFVEDDYEYKTGGVYTKTQFINFG